MKQHNILCISNSKSICKLPFLFFIYFLIDKTRIFVAIAPHIITITLIRQVKFIFITKLKIFHFFFHIR